MEEIRRLGAAFDALEREGANSMGVKLTLRGYGRLPDADGARSNHGDGRGRSRQGIVNPDGHEDRQVRSCWLLKHLTETNPTVPDAMRNCAELVIAQLAQTAICNRPHSLQERSCRWLLTAHDSATADAF
jgi:hypothetical protein